MFQNSHSATLNENHWAAYKYSHVNYIWLFKTLSLAFKISLPDNFYGNQLQATFFESTFPPFYHTIPSFSFQENPLMTVDSSAEFPLYISVNLALTSKDSFDDRDDNSTWLPFSLLPSLPSAKHRQPPSRLHTVYTCSIVLFLIVIFFFLFFSWYSIKSSLIEFRLILSHMGCTNVHGHSVSPGLTRLGAQLHRTWGIQG